MENHAVVQSRGDTSFIIAVFMADFDAWRYVKEQQKNEKTGYTFHVVTIPYCDLWRNLENVTLAALKEGAES